MICSMTGILFFLMIIQERFCEYPARQNKNVTARLSYLIATPHSRSIIFAKDLMHA